MELESFKILKELVSLDEKAKQLKANIEQEYKRIDRVEERKSQAQSALQSQEENLKLLIKKEKELSDQTETLAERILKLKNNLEDPQYYSQQNALENQYAILIAQKEELESSSFELLEKIEECENLIDEKKGFISGVGETIDEIKVEVEEEVAPLRQEIEILKSRIENLKQQIPKEIHSRFMTILAKNLRYGPLAEIKGNSCSVCGFMITPKNIEDVETHHKVLSCQGCQRIFIPAQAKY